MAKRKRSAHPGLTLDGPVEAVEEEFAKGLSHWLQAGPWQVGVANRAMAHSEGAQIFKALLSLTGPVGSLLGEFMPNQATSAEETAAALAPLSLVADVLALYDTRVEDGSFEEVLIAVFGDDLTVDEASDLIVTVFRSANRLYWLVEQAQRERLYVSVLLVYLDDAVARRHYAAPGTARIADDLIRVEPYFVSLPNGTVTTPWAGQADKPLTIDIETLKDILDFMKHYRRERRIAERRLKARQPGATKRHPASP
jgi:hypothetical protein